MLIRQNIMNIMMGNKFCSSSVKIISQVFNLRHVNSQLPEKTVKPYLSEQGVNVLIVPNLPMLIVTDYAENIRKVSLLLKILDVPDTYAENTMLPVEIVPAASLTR